ncbi:MAG: undecaprenyldiphospho-muramoylpentapeptide beta-N-acetylglucosaminyltransferase [Bacteroidia bacterium]|nr:undecaprenyldiphospho-muramoylpentapeptide beta-N-acetylglucosaminyltransferase [Bacteroidia bacterium]
MKKPIRLLKRREENLRGHKYIISGGGTGGHIFPALAIANALMENNPANEILFVGAEGRMEMEKIPAAGYRIIGLPITGIQRSLSLSNLSFPYKLIKSLWQAGKIISSFKPDAVIGVGGYASAAIVYAASLKKIPTLIQEQNSYAGLTNKILSKKAKRICVAFEGMEKYFPSDKITITGNPVRSEILDIKNIDRQEAKQLIGLNPNKRTLLVIGGSLGARTINTSVQAGLETLAKNDIQVIWQTGKFGYDPARAAGFENARVFDFIKDMSGAYAAADAVISRAGAISVSELCIAGKACILVPSPNVAEDHQSKNAFALVNKNAALMIKDSDAENTLINQAIELLNDAPKRDILAGNISALAKPYATKLIIEEINKLTLDS